MHVTVLFVDTGGRSLSRVQAGGSSRRSSSQEATPMSLFRVTVRPEAAQPAELLEADRIGVEGGDAWLVAQAKPTTGTSRCARGEDPSKLLVFLAVGRQAGVVSASFPADKLQYHLRSSDSFSQPRRAARSLECTRACGGTATGLTAE
jgi:hypothetical protein